MSRGFILPVAAGLVIGGGFNVGIGAVAGSALTCGFGIICILVGAILVVLARSPNVRL